MGKKTLQPPQGSIKSVDPSKKPRIVYFQYKPSGNGLRTLRQHFVALQEGDDFQCGDDTSHLFKRMMIQTLRVRTSPLIDV